MGVPDEGPAGAVGGGKNVDRSRGGTSVGDCVLGYVAVEGNGLTDVE